MTTAIKHRLRQILRRSSAPLTAVDLAERTGERASAIANALRRMPDAYIAAWSLNIKGRYVMEWSVARVPANAQKPRPRQQPANQSTHQHQHQ